MNVWRWLGLFFFLAAVTCMVGTRLPAGDKDKEKKDKVEPKDKGDKDKADKDKGDKDKADKDKGEKKPDPPGKGQDEAKFTAFAAGSAVFYQEVTTETIQNMTVMGQQVRQEQKQTFYIKWTPKKPAEGKNLVVEQQVVAIKMNIDIGGNKIAFDSTVPPGKQAKNPMTDFFTALMAQTLTFTINPDDMKVTDIKGREEFIKSLSETNPAIKTLLDTIMSKEALEKMAEPTWWAVPQKTNKGDSWNKTSTLNLGPIGTYDTAFKFTYDGPKDKLDVVKIEAELKYSAPPKDKGGLPFTIKDATLSGKSTSGEALFDRAKGRIASSTLAMKLDGVLNIEVGNMATEIKLNQEQTSRTKTFDELPPEAKAK
jgi:Family of unknown function (DUF6263)